MSAKSRKRPAFLAVCMKLWKLRGKERKQGEIDRRNMQRLASGILSNFFTSSGHRKCLLFIPCYKMVCVCFCCSWIAILHISMYVCFGMDCRVSDLGYMTKKKQLPNSQVGFFFSWNVFLHISSWIQLVFQTDFFLLL